MRRTVNRRQALGAFGTVSLGALLAACGGDANGGRGATTADVATSEGGTSTVRPSTATDRATAELFEGIDSCSVTAEQAQGPYYFDADAIRSDIREDREGVALRVAIRVRDAEACEPIANAVVDVWHCDATGLYSGYEAASTGAGQAGPGGGRSDDERYLRGAQVTNGEGIVEFLTIYPGWYRGRTIHIHAKVHLDRRTVLTTQLYFDEAVTEQVHRREPYAGDSGRDTFNDTDGIFDEKLIMKLSKEGAGWLGVASFDVRSV
jgi:protocatechuate 3,4-dioxygenase beta subunit